MKVIFAFNKKIILAGCCLALLIMPACKKEKSNPEPQNVPPVTEEPLPVADTSLIYIKADNSNIQYTGRIDFTNTLAPEFSFSGVSIKAKFTGPSIDVVLKDYGTGTITTTNYFNILIDGVVDTILKVNSTDTLYHIARGLASGEHTIEVFKRTESSVGKTAFKGFRVLNNTTLSALTPLTRKIEFVGDSYTCGYGNVQSFSTGEASQITFHSANEDNYTAWGALLSRRLEAQYHCTAYSGRGMYRNNTASTSGTIPSFYNRIHPDVSSPTWDPSRYVPDVVVIHLGTNDFAPEASGTALDSAQFVNAYISFVTTVRNNYANAYIICVRPNSVTDYYPAGKKWATRMTNYHNAVVNHFSSDGKVKYFALTAQTAPYGEDWHPSATTHTSMANQIESFLRTTLGW